MTPIAQMQHDDVTVVRMDAGENAFNPQMLDALDAALDAVEHDEGTNGLVLTGTDKAFSYGIDLAWMAQAPVAEQDELMRRVHALFARLLSFPIATVAALNGHAFGAGAMLALACDQRAMRADRGWFCLPEVDFGLPFTVGMTALIRRRLAPQVAHTSMTSGRRWGGSDAAAAGIADAAVEQDALVATAVELARPPAARQRAIVQAIKRELYDDVLAALAVSELHRELLPTALQAPAA